MGGINPNIPLMVQQPQVANPLEEYQRALQIKSLVGQQQLQQQQVQAAATEQQARELQLREAQRNESDMLALRDAFPKYVSKGPNGVGQVDYDGLSNDLAGRGVNPRLIQQLQTEHLNLVDAQSKVSKDTLENNIAHNKAAYEVLEGIKGVTDPEQRQGAYTTGVNRLKALGMDTSSLPPQAPDDKGIEAYETTLGMHGQILADAKELAETREKQSKAASEEIKEFPALGILYNTLTGQTTNVSGGLVPPSQLEAKYIALDQQRRLKQPLSAADQAFLDSYKGYKALVPNITFNLANQTGAGKPAMDVAKQFGMTPEAFDQTAEKYASTGIMPAVGRGPSGIALQRALMNRAGELHPGQSLAANSAEYKANAASLSGLQKNLDAVTAFENTAGKNLDIFLNAAQKAVDTGIPVLNMPARYVAQRLGGTDQAAFETARTTALTEIAKVLSSANAGSGVLSDSARHEVEGLIRPDATLAQIQKAASILKQDMANRHESYQQQVDDISRRLGGKPQAAQATSTTQFTAPTDAPPAPKEDGHKLKSGGQVIAISKGGQWVAP